MKTLIYQSLAILAGIAVQTARLAADQMTSGGFEVGFAGWEAGGNVTIQSAPPYNPTEGVRLAAFNSVNSTPNGYLKQAVATIAGHRYRLEFDVGNLSYNSQHQRMQVIVDDNMNPAPRPPYVTDTIDIAGPGGGATAWVAASYDFIPQGNFVRLAFTDVSTATNSLDLVLDHIRLTELPDLPPVPLVNGGFESNLDGWAVTGNVAVRSTPPYGPTEGGKLAVFNAGNSTPNGAVSQNVPTLAGHRYRLEFDVGNLAYNSQHQRMTVSAISGYKQYLVLDTIDIAGAGGGATAWVAGSYEFTATNTGIRLTFSDASLATNSLDLLLDHVRLVEVESEDLIVNGGFETGLAGWSYSGNSNISVQSSPPYVPTEGASLLAFNAGNTPSNGSTLGQTVGVVPGQHYRFEFDVGNLAYNAQHQSMYVVVSEHVNSIYYEPVQDTIDIPAPLSAGGTRWIPASYVFTPQSDTVVVTFTDGSQVTNSVDMVLDHVRLVRVP